MKHQPLRLRIDYADHNEAFAACLPRTGTVAGTFQDTNGIGPWLLVDLDEPFEYQLKVGEPFQFRLIRVDALLIRSRWENCEVGDPEAVAVFLLLVEEGVHPTGSSIVLEDYIHIAWGSCMPVDDGEAL